MFFQWEQCPAHSSFSLGSFGAWLQFQCGVPAGSRSRDEGRVFQRVGLPICPTQEVCGC